MKKEQLKQAQRIAVLGGSSILVLGSVWQLTKVKTVKDAVMPVIATLVGISAFTYASAGLAPATAPMKVVEPKGDEEGE